MSNQRPKKFTEEIAIEICSRISEGESLNSITRDAHIPNRNTVMRWFTQAEYKVGDMTFDQLFIRARKEQAEYYAELINELAMNAEKDVIDYAKREDVDKRVISSIMQARRTKIDTLKWTSSKLKPEQYGDQMKVQGDTNIQVVLKSFKDDKDNRTLVTDQSEAKPVQQ